MHHTINLAYGDTITIVAPSSPVPVKVAIVKKKIETEEINKYPIFKRVCDAFDVTLEQILGVSRKNNLVLARFIIAYDLCVNYQLQLSSAARLMHRDHTSIIYYMRMYKTHIKNEDVKLAAACKQLEYYDRVKDEIVETKKY